MIRRTLEAFDRCPEVTGITLLISQRNLLEVTRELESDGWRKAIDIRLGGERRQDSVRLGLQSLSQDPPDFVIVHDGARPVIAPMVEGAFQIVANDGAAMAQMGGSSIFLTLRHGATVMRRSMLAFVLLLFISLTLSKRCTTCATRIVRRATAAPWNVRVFAGCPAQPDFVLQLSINIHTIA